MEGKWWVLEAWEATTMVKRSGASQEWKAKKEEEEEEESLEGFSAVSLRDCE